MRGWKPVVASLLVCLVWVGCSKPADGADRMMADTLWVEDLDFFARRLPEVHKNLFFNLSEPEFSCMVDDLRERIPELGDHEILVGIMRILASVGDPHTLAGVGPTGFFSKLPLGVDWYKEGLYVVRTSPELGYLLGKHVVGIEGKPAGEVLDVLARVIPHYNEALLKSRAPQYLAIPEIPAALGLIQSPDTVGFDIESLGRVRVAAIPWGEKVTWVSVLDSLDCDPPLYLQNPNRKYWFAYLEEKKIIYTKYASCTEMKQLSFAEFTEEVLAAIDSLSVEKVVFDIRTNGGGSSALAGPLIAGIKARPNVNGRGHLYVIIGRKTFSSAILNALEIMEGGNAILVGEPTGGKPNHYGEIRFFTLPNSMIPIQYSTKYFSLYPEEIPSILPDIYAEPSFHDLVNCSDPALEAIIGSGDPTPLPVSGDR